MIKQAAEIVEVGEKSIWIKSPRQTACGSCEAKSSCGQNLWSRFFDDREEAIEIRLDLKSLDSSKSPLVNHADLAVGEQVIIGVPESVVLSGSIRVYIMPLITMLVAVLFGRGFIGDSDLVTISSGMIGLVAGFMWVRKHALETKEDPQFHPVLLELLQKSCPPDLISVDNVK